MKTKIFHILFLLGAFFLLPSFVSAAQMPVLNFSDIISGPAIGNTDGVEGLNPSDHGAIVTVWGNYLGDGTNSKVYFTDSNGVKLEAAHIYYWKNADGNLPGGPADLFSFHKMQEIAFSIPGAAADGSGEISVNVNGIDSTTLPFEVRTGDIKFIRSGGDDLFGDGSWDNAWATINATVDGSDARIVAGDLIYVDGVGETNGVSVGLSAPVSGTAADHISMLAYPNTRVNLSGDNGNLFTVFYNGENPYWNWSKVSVNTAVSGFALSQENRIIGVEITGPTVYDGRGGAIGGNCGGVAGCKAPEGGKYFGNYIHNYGTDNGVPTNGNNATTPPYPPALKNTWDKFQHAYSIANGSGVPIEAYEIGWNYLANNPIFQGINISDRLLCGDWTGTIKIHHNVIKNQRGSVINVDFSSCSSALLVPIEIHDNLIMQDPFVSYSGNALKINTPTAVETPVSNNKIYNNTFYEFTASNDFIAGNNDYKNNIIFDNLNLNFFVNPPSTSSHNLFFSSMGSAFPVWAGVGSLNSDPSFKDALSGDFSLLKNSPALIAGTNEAITVAPNDLYGQERNDAISIGAIQNTFDLVAPTAPGGLSVL